MSLNMSVNSQEALYKDGGFGGGSMVLVERILDRDSSRNIWTGLFDAAATGRSILGKMAVQ